MGTARRSWRQTLIALALAAAMPTASRAAIVTLDALDSGHYIGSGLHLQSNQNYLTGRFSGNEHRSFFVFDLSSIAGTITSATLRLFNPFVSQFQPGYSSPDPTETLNLYDVTTSAASVTGGSAGVAGFGDLGSGTLYGTRVVSAADNGTVVEIGLNAAALADLSAASGSFVIGGALGTIAGTMNQFVFGHSMASYVADHTRQLVLDVTPAASLPEPSSLALASLAGGLLLVRRRRAAR